MEKCAKPALYAMPKFQASNFKHARENKKLYQLPIEDQLKVFEDIAEVVPFDFLIGNDDRVIRFEKSSKKIFPRRLPFNMGNVMLQFINGRFHKVHFIDNCTSLYISTRGDNEDSEESDARIDLLHQIFKLVIQDEANLTTQVCQKLKATWDVRQLAISCEQLQGAVASGIAKGIKKMKRMPSPELEETEDPFCLRAQKLIRLNLEFIKK